MSLFDILGGVLGLGSDKAKNKRADQEYALSKQLADQQIDISKYIQGLSEDLMAKGDTQVDPYGGTTGYDPTTGTYKSTLGAVPQALQNASDTEEGQRLTVDQEMRRRALQQQEAARSAASGEGTNALADLDNFRRGIGAVDPAKLASMMRLDRQSAVNAGFDDAQRAAQTLQTRTGSSAVGDALTRLARDRVTAQAQVGDPEADAVQIAQGVNNSRQGNLSSLYDLYSTKGSQVYDTPFTPAPYAALADAKVGDNMKFDLSKYDVAQGGSGTAAAGIGSAAAGIRQGYQLAEANRVANPLGKFVQGIGNSIDVSKLASMFGG